MAVCGMMRQHSVTLGFVGKAEKGWEAGGEVQEFESKQMGSSIDWMNIKTKPIERESHLL